MHHLRVPSHFALALSVPLVVAACGGGGGGGGGSNGGSSLPLTAPASTQAQAATPAATTAAAAATPAAMATATASTAANSAPGSVTPSAAIAPTITAPASAPPAAAASAGVPPSTIVTTTTPASYVAGSEAALAFELLNAERSRCGFGVLAQNTQLDVAAKGHADWLMVNNYIGHYQAAGTPGFTGVSALDRALAAGYTPLAILDEYVAGFGTASLAGKGNLSVRGLLGAPYHTAGLVGGFREIGIAIRSSDEAGSTAQYGARYLGQFDLAYATGSTAQLPAGDAVLTYPCQGTTGTVYQVTSEVPNPVPGRDLQASPLGQPVLVMVRAEQTLTVTSASMKTVSGNIAVSLRAPLTAANDSNRLLTPNQVLLIPDAALTPATDYTVSISGSNDTTPFTKTFSFRTGS